MLSHKRATVNTVSSVHMPPGSELYLCVALCLQIPSTSKPKILT